MNKYVLAGLLLSTTATVASANDVYSSSNQIGGLGYMNVSDDSGPEVNIDVLVGSIASRHNVSQSFSFVPELRLGVGISDDTVTVESGERVEMELEYLLALSLKAQLDVTESLYVFLNPTYAYSSLKSSSETYRASGTNSEFGIGTGAGFEFGNGVAVELSIDKFSDARIASVGLKFPM